MNAHHQQVIVAHEAKRAEIDASIAPLILEIWRAGIDTWQSCERHSRTGKVWIAFETAADAEAFLDAALLSKRASAWAQSEAWYFGMYEPTSTPLPAAVTMPYHPAGWEFHATVLDDCPDPVGHRWFRIVINVLFPRRDLKRVTERLREWNEIPPNRRPVR